MDRVGGQGDPVCVAEEVGIGPGPCGRRGLAVGVACGLVAAEVRHVGRCVAHVSERVLVEQVDDLGSLEGEDLDVSVLLQLELEQFRDGAGRPVVLNRFGALVCGRATEQVDVWLRDREEQDGDRCRRQLVKDRYVELSLVGARVVDRQYPDA